MKRRSLRYRSVSSTVHRGRALVAVGAVVGCSALLYACSSDEPAPAPSDGGAGGGAGTGGRSTGGKSNTGGRATGGTTNSGGTQDSGAGGTDASDGSSGDTGASSGGTAGGGGAGGNAGTGGAKGDARCTHCGSPYPVVPYPVENPDDPNKAMLGKILFWEEQIGELNANACGTCHRSEAGGSDPRAATNAARQPGTDGILDPTPGLRSDDIRGGQGVPHCTGLSDGGGPSGPVQVTQRKPPTYFDAMFARGVFWDGRAGYCASTGLVDGCFVDPDTGQTLIKGQTDPNTNYRAGGALEAQAIGPPVSPVEMACTDETWLKIRTKLETVTPLAKAKVVPRDMQDFIGGLDYPNLFERVYGDTNRLTTTSSRREINTRRIVYAIATHERRLKSDQTPWDRWNAGDDSALTPLQVTGFNLFMNKGRCGSCHTPPLFTDTLFHFIGFHDPNVANPDATGLEKITSALGDKGKFKTPTLRNVGLREAGGLLHSGDGPGHDLNSVMTLYKSGGRRDADAGDTNITPLIDPQIVALNLTQSDIDAIIEFLRHGLTDPRVQNATPPFDRPKLSTE